ncbi:MAG TPA: hypothetical protein VN455_06615, partial [Methanotrichaceae archaeon]|nr:hypothetical protein [Methanotrichaceae archaeon]
ALKYRNNQLNQQLQAAWSESAKVSEALARNEALRRGQKAVIAYHEEEYARQSRLIAGLQSDNAARGETIAAMLEGVHETRAKNEKLKSKQKKAAQMIAWHKANNAFQKEELAEKDAEITGLKEQLAARPQVDPINTPRVCALKPYSELQKDRSAGALLANMIALGAERT